MSILVALAGPDGALVATDGRRIAPDGQFRDDYPKVFRIPGIEVACGSTGLLEFGGLTVPQVLEKLKTTKLGTLDELALAGKELLEEELSKIPPAEVGIDHRWVDVVFVGTPRLNRKGMATMRGLVFRPDAAKIRIVGEIRCFNGYCVTGDDQASNAVTKFLGRQKPAPGTLQKKGRERLAKAAIQLGVKECGAARCFPNILSCGGSAHVLAW
jgi:hypothetical protein